MIDDRVLDLAVERGIVDPRQAAALRSLAAEHAPLADAGPEPDDEQLRFVSGFADIFVTLGIVLFLGAAALLSPDDFTATLFIAAAAWGLAEFFTRRKHMALPSIVLLAIFACSAYLAAGALFGATPGALVARLGWFSRVTSAPASASQAAGAALVAAVFVALHYLRFRIPITVAAGTGALLAAAVLGLFALLPEQADAPRTALICAAGLVAFALAMRFDLSDPLRATRRTDIAFWLHLLAAPLIVHSLFAAVGAERSDNDPVAAASVLVLFLALASVAVLIDRRALLVSGLLYAGLAFGSLVRGVGAIDAALALSMLAVGAFVLLLSAGWGPLRAHALRILPHSLSDRLPRPTSSP